MSIDLNTPKMQLIEMIESLEQNLSSMQQTNAALIKKLQKRESAQPDDCRNALKRLVDLKAHKDSHGKNNWYVKNQADAWEQARSTLESTPVRESVDVNAATKYLQSKGWGLVESATIATSLARFWKINEIEVQEGK